MLCWMTSLSFHYFWVPWKSHISAWMTRQSTGLSEKQWDFLKCPYSNTYTEKKKSQILLYLFLVEFFKIHKTSVDPNNIPWSLTTYILDSSPLESFQSNLFLPSSGTMVKDCFQLGTERLERACGWSERAIKGYLALGRIVTDLACKSVVRTQATREQVGSFGSTFLCDLPCLLGLFIVGIRHL